MRLNDKQEEAAGHLEGPMLIIAGAGSGKTTVLSHRTKRLIDKGVDPRSIMMLTFTNKAVRGLQQQVTKRVGEEAAEATWISTFHRLGLYITGEADPTLVTLHPAGSRQVLKKIVEGMEVDAEDLDFVRPAKLLSLISLFKSELVLPSYLYDGETLDDYIDSSRVKRMIRDEIGTRGRFDLFRKIYHTYQYILDEYGQMDLDDILLKSVWFLTESQDLLEALQARFRYFMIDEFQDTNRAQYVLAQLLSDHTRHLAIVGDDFQSIYAFRGSDMRNILDFDKHYPDAFTIRLEENYRSTPVILEAANQLIAHNKDQREKTLFTGQEEGEPITGYRGETVQDEAKWVSNEIKRLVEEEGYSYQDIAIFYRSHSDGSLFEVMLPEEEIPFTVVKEGSFFEREEVKDLLAYASFVTDPHDTYSLRRIINTPKRGIGKASVDRIVEAKTDDVDYISLVTEGALPGVKGKSLERIRAFGALLKRLEDGMSKVGVAKWLKACLQISGYDEMVEGLEEGSRREKRIHLDKLVELAGEFEASEDEMTLDDFIERVKRTDVDATLTEDEDFDRVQLLTVHASKGLEFPVVFVVGMKESGFPSPYAASPFAIEEERRICYVAFTRAKDRLYLSYPKKKQEKNEEGEKVEVETTPSRFLNEFDDRLISWNE
ncbi:MULTISPECIES: ATP-dependent helicase [Pontibacillus]|uniref:DNA 3'-5' helicase n=1 Tax=Pontibacillus chungwhensis TaxID=265426 RepID=A0ABY8V0Q2_9BACI|nr:MULTISPECIES: 3'-5' exonuclease [Pontibacillus]MCD5324334.1 ATP-dependent helicase [Pontibacillus sp. HN14]WIF99367.1 3'-5' exonuclease [Pontibacillus chungwhensis]